MYEVEINLSPKDILEKEFKFDAKGYRPKEVEVICSPSTIITNHHRLSEQGLSSSSLHYQRLSFRTIFVTFGYRTRLTKYYLKIKGSEMPLNEIGSDFKQARNSAACDCSLGLKYGLTTLISPVFSSSSICLSFSSIFLPKSSSGIFDVYSNIYSLKSSMTRVGSKADFSSIGKIRSQFKIHHLCSHIHNC